MRNVWHSDCEQVWESMWKYGKEWESMRKRSENVQNTKKVCSVGKCAISKQRRWATIWENQLKVEKVGWKLQNCEKVCLKFVKS